jgi:GT2 family glycosyltransferase
MKLKTVNNIETKTTMAVLEKPMPAPQPQPQKAHPHPDSPDVSVIIVSWNVREHLIPLLASLYETTRGVSFEVFVCDNDSHDGSADAVAENFPQVHLIRTGANLGFGKASNKAIRRAAGKYILILNPDCLLWEDSVSILVRFLEEHPDAGAVGCRMVDEDGVLVPTARDDISVHNLFLEHFFHPAMWGRNIAGRFSLIHWDHSSVREVDWLIGACWLIRKSVVDEVGPFDESFYLFHEETDWCYRIRQKGWRIYFTPETTILHYGSRSALKRWHHKRRIYLIYYQEKHTFISKHWGWAALLGHRLFISTLFLIRILGASIMLPFSEQMQDDYFSQMSFYLHALAVEAGLLNVRKLKDEHTH